MAVACTGAPAEPTGTAAATTQAVATATAQPATLEPTLAPPTDAAPTATAAASPDAAPTFSIPSVALPSFAPDNELAARFPTEIDGQPVTDVTTVLWMEFLLSFAPEQAQQFRSAMSSVGIDADRMSFGSATATVDDETVQLQALRTAGADAGLIVANFATIGAVFNPDEEQPTLTQANFGGKNVTKATDADGDVTYLYVSSDVLWFISDLEESQAATILAALP
jgi:hypothetical protein